MKSEELKSLTICSIFPNPNQPRKEFNADRLEELAMSIREYGVLEPIVVTHRGEGFMIIAGERRWRASQLAGLDSIPAKIIEADDALIEELALLENIQRQDLNVIEEAIGFKSLLDRGWTKEELARKMGFKQIWRVDERTSLLNLTQEHQKLAVKGLISNSQAFEMSRVSPDKQALILKKIWAGELGSYNKLRSFVEGIITVENQGSIFALKSLTPSEEETIRDLENVVRSVERFIKTVHERGKLKHFKKLVFHSEVTIERMDLIIQQLQRFRKTMFEGEGIKKALKEAV